MFSYLNDPNFVADRGNADSRHARLWFTLLAQPDAIVELRALHAPQAGTVSGYFEPTHADEFVEACVQWSRVAEGVYTTINPVRPDLLDRAANHAVPWARHATSDADILCRSWLPIDFDSIRPKNASATADEHAAARALGYEVADWLECFGFPPTSMVIADSGNGCHVLVRIDLPNDDLSRNLVKTCLEALAAKFNNVAVIVDQTMFNAARILKCYGTAAAKGDETPDRPHTLARLLDVPDHVVPVNRDLLEKLAGLAPPSAAKLSVLCPHANGDKFDVAAWLAKYKLPVVETKPWNGGKLYVLNPCPWDPGHDNRSAVVIQHASGAISAKCHHNGCAGMGWHDLRDKCEPGWRDRRHGGLQLPASLPPAIARQYQKIGIRNNQR